MKIRTSILGERGEGSKCQHGNQSSLTPLIVLIYPHPSLRDTFSRQTVEGEPKNTPCLIDVEETGH